MDMSSRADCESAGRWYGRRVLEHASGRQTLLRRGSAFRLLFGATACSAVGTYLAALALSVDIFDRTSSGRWLAALLIADFLPIVVIGLTLGPLVDRLQRRRLMISADLVRAGVFCALPFVHEPAAIVALAGVNGIATGFFRPAVWAGLPNLVDDDDLPQANSLLSTVEHVAWMVGPIAAGALLSLSGPSLAYWINAATFVVSALLVARISSRLLQSEESLSRGHWTDVRDGIGLVLRARALRTVLVVWCTAAVATAGVNVAEVVLAKDALGAGNVGLGVLVAATGVGLVVGSLLAPGLIGRFGMTRVYGGSLALMGLGFGTAAAAPTIAVAALLAAAATMGNGTAIVCNQLLVQRGSPDAMRGRALAVLMSLYYSVLGIGMAAAGVLTDTIGPRATWALAGCVYLLASLVAFVMTRHTREALEETRAATGVERIQGLLAQVEVTRELERTRPPRRLPYLPRRRASG
jgi:MFS family permease